MAAQMTILCFARDALFSGIISQFPSENTTREGFGPPGDRKNTETKTTQGTVPCHSFWSPDSSA
jgi:hypothetical protein